MDWRAPDRGLAGADRHDLARVIHRHDLQLGGEVLPRNGEGMVQPGLERGGEPFEDARARVGDRGGPAVRGPSGPHDPPAVCRRDALVPQAHPQDRHRRAEPRHDFRRDPRLRRRARPRRDDDVRRRERRHVVHADFVVPHRHRPFAEPPQVPRGIVDERSVVVDQHDHEHASSAARSPRALARLSAYSRSGSESRTTPQPTWRYATPRRTTIVRIATFVSMPPSNPMYPTAPVYTPRLVGSSSAITCMARTLGAPVIGPPGNAARSRSTASTSGRNLPVTMETR